MARKPPKPARGDVIAVYWEDIATQWGDDVTEDKLSTAKRLTVGWFLGTRDDAHFITETIEDGRSVGGTAFPSGCINKISVVRRGKGELK